MSMKKSKKDLYKIKNNYLRFWFAFVYSNMSFIESGHSRIVMNKIKNSLVKNHIAFVYELSRYWNSKDESDIVILDPEGKNLILGECKYWTEPVGVNILKTESVVWGRNNRKVWYVLFRASGFTDELKALAESREDLLLCHEEF